ncbi:MAG: four helix bundle suffix domain-containing protein [Bacteroidaceae bacterium]
MLYKLIEKLKEDFLQQGGIKEQMSAARRQWREEHGMGWMNGYQGKK